VTRPPPGQIRSRERESEATRRTILDAAGELLATVGEDGLSIREVCHRAGVKAPTVYHHFGDKQTLVDRVVDDCFSSFDRAFADRPLPGDPVEALRFGLDRYVEYGVAHPVHYQLMFQRRSARLTPAAMASYDRLRRAVAAIDAAGRLLIDVEIATAAFWAAVHGVTSLLVTGGLHEAQPVVALVRDAMVDRYTRPAPSRRAASGARRGRNQNQLAEARPRARAAAAPERAERKARWRSENRS
jgi:AcrR family transcriptional regulator